jgi:hypothetical protein
VLMPIQPEDVWSFRSSEVHPVRVSGMEPLTLQQTVSLRRWTAASGMSKVLHDLLFRTVLAPGRANDIIFAVLRDTSMVFGISTELCAGQGPGSTASYNQLLQRETQSGLFLS